MIQRSTRRGADDNCISWNGRRGADQGWRKHQFRRSIWYEQRGTEYLLQVLVRSNLSYLSTFFYISHLVIGCCRSFYSFTIQSFERFCRFEFDLFERFWLVVGSTHIRQYHIIPVYFYPCSVASLLSPLSPVHSYGGCAVTPTMANQKWLT